MNPLIIVLFFQMGSSSLPNTELSLGGVLLCDTPAHVQAVLGMPARSSPELGAYDLRFEYPGMEIVFGGGAQTIISTEATYCTPAGACPGMSLKKLESLYGRGLHQRRSIGDSVLYSTLSEECFIEAFITQQVVKKLIVLCQP